MAENNPNLPQTQNYAEDEINLLEYVYVLVKNKWIIIGMAILGFAIGHIAAIIKGPVYVADAVIAPKESESISTPNLSGLGMFGGMVASQLSMGGNASLEKIDLLLSGRTFNAEFVKEKEIDKLLAPFLFESIWDSVNKNWIHDTLAPKPIGVGGYVRGELLEKEILKNGTMSLKITHEDSAVAHTILDAYLEYLDTYVRENTQNDAKENKDYLEEQLINVSDPLLRAKLQELIAKEIEEMMVVSKEAFKVVDEVLVGKSFSQKKVYPLILTFLFFVLALIVTLLLYILKSFEYKNEDDRDYLIKIKKSILSPFLKG